MTKKDFLLQLDELIEAEPGSLNGSEQLRDLSGWNSLAVMGFIAMVDDRLGVTVSAKRLAECQTVDDLVQLLDGRVSG